ncbi:NUDIX domain-containing protein [Sphingomonas sp. H160509]|uniref:NUDIX domain-containing protein n=1 Tax=Sphingomonas sp. H160509 TaxID=2955313 RepID=UPI002096F7BD|nr:NUDIX domain-containing protein [Sphingomonas sp. H160509]
MGVRHRLIGKAARLVWRIGKPRTIGVRALLLDRDGRVALVRHTYADHWYLPGGGVKKGESIAAALLRELAEEVAIADAVIERVLGVYHSRGGGQGRPHRDLRRTNRGERCSRPRRLAGDRTGGLVPAGRPAGDNIAGDTTAHRRIPAGRDRDRGLVTRALVGPPDCTIKATMRIT